VIAMRADDITRDIAGELAKLEGLLPGGMPGQS
jgi:hypothetical protein